MAYTITFIKKDGYHITVDVFLLFLFSIFFHQSAVIMGVNFSFADIFCFLILLIVITREQLFLPIKSIIFFIFVSVVVLITTFFYTPSVFMYNPEPIKIFSEYMKLVVILLYFIVGYNLFINHQIETIIKWYSLSGIVIAIIGILLTFSGLNQVFSILFDGGIRYKGFMNDPNYFSILQISALVYFIRSKGISLRYKYAASIIVILSVLISGSKTGVVTLLCYFIFRSLEFVIMSRKTTKSFIATVLLLLFLVSVLPIVLGNSQYIFQHLSSVMPAFERVQYLFSDFNTAISGNGSDRSSTWEGALQIIQSSPIIGIGIGTYIGVVTRWFHANDIAHNTFLQLAAEWGIPLAVFLFSFMLFLIAKTTFSEINKNEKTLIMRDILIIFLIGSIAISFNNARVLWLFFGGLVSSLSNPNFKLANKKTGEEMENILEREHAQNRLFVRKNVIK